MNYPTPWKPTGYGSYRSLREGSVQCTWRDAAGAQRRVTFSGTEGEAQTFLQGKHAERTRAPLGLPVDVEWAEGLRLYDQRQKVRQTTEKYLDTTLALLEDLRQHCGCRLRDVSPLHIEGWLSGLATAAKESGSTRWAGTCNRKRVQISGFFRWLYRHRMIGSNPVDATEPFRAEKRIRQSLTPEQYAKLLAKCEPAVADLFDFLLLTGVRIGEAIAMRRTDVQGGVWLIPKRKGHNQLAIPLVGELGAIVARQPLCPDGLVWHWRVSLRGRDARFGDHPITAEYVRQLLRLRCERATVPVISPHGLRHAMASWAQSAGLSRDAIQAALGHDVASTTALYMHGDSLKTLAGVQSVIVKMRGEAVEKLA